MNRHHRHYSVAVTVTLQLEEKLLALLTAFLENSAKLEEELAALKKMNEELRASKDALEKATPAPGAQAA